MCVVLFKPVLTDDEFSSRLLFQNVRYSFESETEQQTMQLHADNPDRNSVQSVMASINTQLRQGKLVLLVVVYAS